MAIQKLLVCLVVFPLAFAIGGFSFYQLSHVPPLRVTYLALGSAFLLSDTTTIPVNRQGSFAIIYTLFHALLFCASMIAVLLLASRHSEANHQKLRLALGVLLLVPIAWLMSYWLLFGMTVWGLLAVLIVWRWPSSERITRYVTLASIFLVGVSYLVALLVWPTVPPNAMP